MRRNRTVLTMKSSRQVAILLLALVASGCGPTRSKESSTQASNTNKTTREPDTTPQNTLRTKDNQSDTQEANDTKPKANDTKPKADGKETEGLSGDWPQWGGSPARNNTPHGNNIPTDWNVGGYDPKTGRWQKEKSKNIKWVAQLGSQSYGNPVVAGGKVFVGTNNDSGKLERFPAKEFDLGCLLAFRESDGKFLWQHSSRKLKSGRAHDFPAVGICSAPLVEGQRLWFVTSRGEVACLDTKGFLDGQNDGPFQEEKSTEKDEADVIWYFDMMKELGSLQHNMASCSVTAAGDLLFVCTSNGIDEKEHEVVPAPNAPSFIALDKNTGEVLWTDNSPGKNILHGQWASPAYGVLGSTPQVIFCGGDGWLYSFLAKKTSDKKAKLLWKFDTNPKQSKWKPGGRGTRNSIVATPVIHDSLVYIAVGQDPIHGEGSGHLWCIDPTKRGDVSPELAVMASDHTKILPHRKIQAVDEKNGEKAIANPNSAVVWHYSSFDLNDDGKISFEETMHRTGGIVAIKDGLLFIADISGLLHCLDVKTGKPYWTHDMMASAWGSPLIVEDKVYIGDEDGEISIFRLSKKKERIAEIEMEMSVHTTPIVANNVLFISSRKTLFAIEAPKADSDR